MRLEQDSLGTLQLSTEEYYGISTARLLAVAGSFGPEVSSLLLRNIVMVRQAQALVFGRNGAWNATVAESIQAAANQLLTNEQFFAEQIKVRVSHGGGARSLVVNVDEVLANVALETQGRPRGEYHRLAGLFQLDTGFSNHNVCLMALHVTIVQMLDEISGQFGEAIHWLRNHALAMQEQNSIAQINYQDIKIHSLGEVFSCRADGLSFIKQQLFGYRKELCRLWNETPEVLACLKELLDIEIEYDASKKDFPVNDVLYSGLSGLLKNLATFLLQFCNELKRLVVLRKELDLPNQLPSQVFNPVGREMIALDTVSQMSVVVVGNDAMIAAALNIHDSGGVLSFNLISNALIDSLRYSSVAVKMLTKQCLMELRGNPEMGAALQENSPLQAEKLIPIIGYDRAVQVARISALTAKPVKTVVVRMKLLNEAQAETLFFAGCSEGQFDEQRTK